jgi:hypothetical protein
LGIADNPDHIEKWLSNSNELLDGIEMLNNKLAEKQEITEADIELLSNLTARFDNRMI